MGIRTTGQDLTSSLRNSSSKTSMARDSPCIPLKFSLPDHSALNLPVPMSAESALKRRLAIEWSMLRERGYLPVILIGLAMQVVHNIAHNLVYMLSSKPTPEVLDGIRDLGFENLPFLESQFSMIILYFLFILLGITLVLPRLYAVVVLHRALLVNSVAIGLRIVTFMSTILPAPALHCREAFDPPRTIADIFLSLTPSTGCGDLNFSSHMMYGLVCALATSRYCTVKHSGMVAWGLVGSLGLFILMQRDHWTSDVVVSSYTVPLIWHVSFHFFPEDLSRPKVKAALQSVVVNHQGQQNQPNHQIRQVVEGSPLIPRVY